MANRKAAYAVLAPAAKRGAGLRNNWLLGVALCPSHNTGQARRSLRSLGLRHIFASATLRQKRRLPRERCTQY